MLNAKSCYKHLASVKKKKRNRPPFFPPLLSPHTPYTIPPYNPPTRKEKKLNNALPLFFCSKQQQTATSSPQSTPTPTHYPDTFNKRLQGRFSFIFFRQRFFKKKNSASCYHANMLQA